MEFAHTAGPLAYDAEEGRIYVDDGDVEPTVAHIDIDNTDEEQALADGLLFAAAPDLLKALNALVEAIDFEGPDGRVQMSPGTAYEWDQLREARAAIRRATGESS